MSAGPPFRIHSPVQNLVRFDPATISPADSYRLLIGSIVPRPIAFVSTIGPDGIGNLAPFSFFNGVSSQPPCLVISVTRKPDGSKKDTLVNIEANGEFVVNTVAEWMLDPMNHCSAEYPYGIDEMKQVGLTPLASEKIRPARVKESPVQMECVLEKLVEIGNGDLGSAVLIVGRVVLFHVFDAALDPRGRLKIEELKPLSRLGGIAYGKLGETFDLARPKI